MDLNKVMIIGRLTRDPEIRTTPNGQSVASFSLATNRVWKDQSGSKQEKVEYHNIVAWGKLAEIVGQYLGKGRRTYIEGRMQTRDWEGQDGVKRYRTEVIAENMIMLDGRGQEAPMTGQAAAHAMENNMPAPSASHGNEDDEIKVEDIPF